MPVTCNAVHKRLYSGLHEWQQNKCIPGVGDSYGNYCREVQPSFSLVGTYIHLQQRFTLVTSSKETISHLRRPNKTYSCSVHDDLEERKTQTDSKIISGGDRRASAHRRVEKPKASVVYKKKTKSKNRSVAIRQPLVMCTMNLPGNHGPHEKATQMFPSTEEAKQMLRRLLASTNHECMMAESVSADDVRQRQETRTELLDKPDYLEDTYDYLFHRHVQTLNGVIRKQEQQEADEACGIYQQKHGKQVIQLCCDDGRDCDDTSIIIGSTKLSNHHNSSTVSQSSFACNRATACNSQDSDKNDINSSDFFASRASCKKSENNEMKGWCKKGEPMRMSDNQIEICHNIQKSETMHRKNSDEDSVNINIITKKINALDLQEVKVPQKPVITFNHVPETSECSSSSCESESLNLKQIKTISALRSNSSSPLLEVPISLEDLTSEMMRPPIN